MGIFILAVIFIVLPIITYHATWTMWKAYRTVRSPLLKERLYVSIGGTVGSTLGAILGALKIIDGTVPSDIALVLLIGILFCASLPGIIWEYGYRTGRLTK